MPMAELFGAAGVRALAGPVFLGPRFGEAATSPTGALGNYALGVAWLAHEMFHSWTARLHWPNQANDVLKDPGCKCHWSYKVLTPVATPVWKLFSSEPYVEASIMGGAVTARDPDGRRQLRSAVDAVTGLSRMDLYSMGLADASDVPDVWLIVEGRWRRIPFTEIAAANDPIPRVERIVWRVNLQLIHEDGRPPDEEKLLMARGLEKALIQYVATATNGLMTLVPVSQPQNAAGDTP